MNDLENSLLRMSNFAVELRKICPIISQLLHLIKIFITRYFNKIKERFLNCFMLLISTLNHYLKNKCVLA